MALFRRSEPKTPPTPKAQPHSILAAATDITKTGVSAWRARANEDPWQREAWYQYDICGELRYATNWIGNAVSMASLQAAELDPDTGLVTGPTEDPTVQAIAMSVLGGADRRAQMQATVALNYQIAGEVFILIRSGQERDEWLVLSSSEVEERGGSFQYRDPVTGMLVQLDTNRDMLIRVWSPHPRFQSRSDSAVRASLPILKEIERTSQNIAARLDSRLSGAGVWIIPKELDFPGGDNTPAGPQGLMESMMRAAEASLTNPGTAASQVPIVLEVPGEQVANFNYQTFATELTGEVLELRTASIRRLALSLDMPLEILTGTGDSNHWGAWQIEEQAYKIHVAPLLDRLADGLTQTYFRPALIAAGVANPERYIIAFDVTDIISRPNRVEELTSLWDRLLVSDEALRAEAGVPDSDIPSDQEADKRYVMELVKSDTSLLADPGIRSILGLEQLTVQPAAAPQLPAGEPEADVPSDRALPATQGQDSGTEGEGLVAAAELMVWDALSRAGGRLLTREHRGQYVSTPKHELYLSIKATSPSTLLEGSFQFVGRTAQTFGIDADRMQSWLHAYCTHLIESQSDHSRREMMTWLK